MTYNKTKLTKRFSFGINRNDTAKRAGSNTLTISTIPEGSFYASGTTAVTMTVKEALVLQRFLNSHLDLPVDPVTV